MISANLKYRFYTSLALLTLLIFIMSSNLILVYSCIIFGIISSIEFSFILKKIVKKKINIFLFNVFFIIFLFAFYACILFFFNFIESKLILFFLLIGCIASDIGGYVVGKKMKGPKLTKISPNKTISGSIGSIAFTNIFMYLLYLYFFGKVDLEIFFIAVITSISCQCGDLFFSYLKRKAKIKDTGNFLPGHGGVLDRLDGIYFGVPMGLVSLLIIN